MSTRAFLAAQMVKNLPAMQETWVQSLGWEDSLEKRMATHSSILAWRIPWTEEPGGLQSTRSQSDTTDCLALTLEAQWTVWTLGPKPWPDTHLGGVPTPSPCLGSPSMTTRVSVTLASASFPPSHPTMNFLRARNTSPI